MSLAWVAGSVRAGLLASRRMGRAGARGLAESPSLAEALGTLAGTPYGRELGPGLTLEVAQRGVAATLLWHLRVLAGWLPPVGGELLRALAAWFEIANVQDRMAYFAGEPYRPAFELGGLATAWPGLARTTGPAHLRSALAGSRWGDPGGDEPAEILEAMRAAWAGRVVVAVPEAAGWARAGAALLLVRAAAAGHREAGPRAGLGRLAGLGDGWQLAAGPAELTAFLPANLGWVLVGVEAREELWQAEARWWSRVEEEAQRLTASRQQGRATIVGVAALLAADAWRVRAALAAAAAGGGPEAFDAVA